MLEDVVGMFWGIFICFDLLIFEIFFLFIFGGKVIVVRNVLLLNDFEVSLEVIFCNMVLLVMELLLFGCGFLFFVKVVNLVGEVFISVLVRCVYEEIGIERFYNFYGLSECIIYLMFEWIVCDDCIELMIGRFIVGICVYVFDKNFNLGLIGMIGELYLGGSGVLVGYIGLLELMSEKFLFDLFVVDEGVIMYVIGD